MTTGQNIADEVRTQLSDGDASNLRWSDAEILSYINASQRQIVTLVPEANVTETLVSVTDSEVRRTIPSGGIKFLRAWGYDSLNSKRGPPLIPVELDALNSGFPEWSYPDHQTSHMDYPTWEEEHDAGFFEHVAHDPRSPKTFYIFPPKPSSGGVVEFLGSSSLITGTMSTGSPVTGSYTLPSGSNNRLILVVIQSTGSGETGDPNNTGQTYSLVVTYGGVTMTTRGVLDAENHTLALAAATVNGESFANTTLSLSFNGDVSPSTAEVIAKVFVFDNVDPTYDDITYDFQSDNAAGTELALSPVTPGQQGDLVFSAAIEDLLAEDEISFSATDTSEYTTYPTTSDTSATEQSGDNESWRAAYSVNVGDAQTITWTPDASATMSALAAVFPALTDFQLYVEYSDLPTALSSLSDTFDLGDEYLNAAVDYVTYRCLTKDGRYSVRPDRRMQLWNNFRQSLGLKAEADARVDPGTNRPPEDDHG